MIKKAITKFVLSLMLLSGIGIESASAQKCSGLFNHLSVGVGVGTYGIDVEAAAPIGRMFAIRGGVGFLPDFNIKTDVNASVNSNGMEKDYSMDIEGKLKRVQGKLIVNFYPFKSGLFIAAGAYFGGDKIVEIQGHSDQLQEEMATASSAGIIIGDQEIPVDKNGNVAAGLKVQNFRPYLGIGFGRVVPNKRINFMFELGVQFHGTPDIYTNNGTISKTDIENADDKITKIIDKVKVYPVLNLKLNTRIL